MPHLVEDLAAILSQVSRPGDYYAAGTQDIHTPRLEVDGVGTIALPLLPVQAAELIAAADRAPYGRGSETLVDTDVRRTWQLDAVRVRIRGRHWDEDLAQILARVTTGLGVGGRVRAELYKLLVYDTGAFFVPHRDTEKAPGMFATLVIVLPCDYTGGELSIRHKDREMRLDLRLSDPAEVAFAAFYADCRHQVLPVTSGYRLTLVYNLLREGGGPLPEAPDYEVQQGQVAELLRTWSEGTSSDGDSAPAKLVYPLEHAYTEAELGFDSLKGADAAVTAVLAAAAEAAACDLHLALLTVEEYGWAEYAGGRWGEEEYEIGEVTDSSYTLHDWCRPDGTRPAMDALPFDDDEVCPPDALDDLKDAEPEFEEATGNAGVSFERFYQRAALVLWPRAERAEILAQGGPAVSVPFLGELVRAWEAGGAAPGDAAHRDALALATAIRKAWPTEPWARRQASQGTRAGALLDALARLGEVEQCIAFLVEHTLTGAYGPADNPGITAVLRRLPPHRASPLLAALVATHGSLQADGCARLLLLCTEPPPFAAETLRPAAMALNAALAGSGPTIGDASTVAAAPPSRPTPELVTDTLTALERIDPTLAQAALERFLSLPARYPVDALLLPAAMTLREATARPAPASFEALRQAVLAHLDRRIAEPLEPPSDWTRPAEVTCTCTYCTALNRFLAAPDQREWRLKAAQAQRTHAEHMIAQHRCDLDLATEKRGSPHTLVCTKNQASYERWVQQRKQDLAHRGRLTA